METGNITKAAEQLHLAQTALGLQIRNLEETLNVQLFVRHSRGITATAAGKLLYDRAVEILSTLEKTKREVMALGGGRREDVRLGVAPSILRLIGSDLVVAAREAMPDVSVHFVEELSFRLVDALERGDLDLILAFGVPDLPGLVRVPLSEEALLFISRPDGCTGGTAELSEVVASDLALPDNRDSVWKVLHDAATHMSLNVNVTYLVQSMGAIVNLVTHGLATSVVPLGVVVNEIRDGQVRARSISRPPLKRTLYLTYRATRASFVHEEQLVGFINDAVRRLIDASQPYGCPIGQWTLAPLRIEEESVPS